MVANGNVALSSRKFLRIYIALLRKGGLTSPAAR